MGMMVAKQYGKLSPDQFSRLVKRLLDVRSQMHELPAFLREHPQRVDELLGDEHFSWGYIYELPFLEQMALLFIQIGMHIPLHEAAQSDDPQEAVLNWAEDGSPLYEWYEVHENNIEWKHLLWLAIVLQRNILAIMLYHQSMGALVQAVIRRPYPRLLERSIPREPTSGLRLGKT